MASKEHAVTVAARALYYSVGQRVVAWEDLDDRTREQYEREGLLVVDALDGLKQEGGQR